MLTISTFYAGRSKGYRGLVRDQHENVVASTADYAERKYAYSAAKELRARMESEARASAAKPATYEQAKATHAALTSAMNRASDALRPFPKGAFGLTPDDVKVSPEYRAAKAAFDAANEALRDHTGFMVKTFATEMRADRKRPRKAYDIRFRCTLNGCDWTSRLWLRDAGDAFEAMYRALAYGSRGAGEGKLRYSRDFYRVVSCDVSADQSRPTL